MAWVRLSGRALGGGYTGRSGFLNLPVAEGDAPRGAIVAVVREEGQEDDRALARLEGIGVVLAGDGVDSPVVVVPLVQGGVLQATFLVGGVGLIAVSRGDRFFYWHLTQVNRPGGAAGVGVTAV